MRLLPLALLFALAACRADTPAPPPAADIPFRPEGTVTFFRATGEPITRIAVEIAATDSARQRGLMERKTLPEKAGMLFLMDREEVQSFWMYNTPLPLDILFVNDSLEIVTVAARTQSFSQQQITSAAPARFVVEVRAGFAERYGVGVGDRIAWRRAASDAASP